MKRLFILLIPICILLAVLFPGITFRGASDGLSIWFQRLLPTLLPFMILSNLCIATGLLDVISQKAARLTNPCLFVTMLFGITLGLPIGAKLASDFTKEHRISEIQGNILLCTCNQASPAFVGGYLMTQCLNMPQLILPSYAILYLPPLIVCLILLLRSGKAARRTSKKVASRFYCSFQILDASIMNGFEVITKLGGYLMIFGIIGAYLHLLPIRQPPVIAMVMGMLEITNGIHQLAQCPMDPKFLYVISMALMAFGGLCTYAQSCSVISGSGLNRRTYFLSKTGFAVLTIPLAYLVYAILC